MTNLAQKGTAGGNAAQYVGASPLQTQAFGAVAQNVGNYQPSLTAAGQNYGTAANTDITGAANPYLQAGTQTSGLTQANPYLTSGTSSAAPLVGDYMNPYTSSVVDQIRLANQQNIAQNLSPAITSGAVGSGQFGSARGANALALGISNANIGALNEQSKALQSGYAQALAAAQQQRANQLTAGQTAGTLQNQFNTNQVTAGQVAGNTAAQEAAARTAAATGQLNLGQQVQQSGLADVNALSTLGQQEQQIAQNKQLFPLDVAAKQAAIMSGAQIPTTVTQTMEGSPLSAIAGLGSLTAGMFTSQPKYDPVTGKIIGTTTPAANIGGALSSAFSGISSLFPSLGGSNISGTPAAKDPYTGQPSGSLTTPTAPGNNDAAYFDLPAGISPDGKGGYVNQYGAVTDANGTLIGLPEQTYTGAGSLNYNPGDSASTGSWVDAGDGSLVWQPN
jgi:hypothetical protein